MDKNQNQQGTAGQQASGFSGQRTGAQVLDARYSEEPHTITDRLRSTMNNSLDGDFIVIGQKQDGSPFLWSSGDQTKAQELAKVAAPVLAGLDTDR
jgi:hypothetical protein